MSRLEIPSLVILLARISVVVSFCDFGSLPGFWDGDQYVLLNEECVLERYADNWTELQAAKDGDHLLLIGDSFDRELIQGVANRGRHKFYDYTPSVLDDNKPSKIGRNIQFSVGRQWVSNLFIFGANNEGLYPEASAAGHAEGMHNLTFSRICEDFRRYSSYSQDPYMIVVNSLLWDVMDWYLHHGRRGWEDPRDAGTLAVQWRGDYNVPPNMSQRMRAKTIYQVFEPGPSGPGWRAALKKYEDEITSLVKQVRGCFPLTKLLCWRTSPLPPTDYRNRHFWLKPPYVVAAFNSIGRHVARRMGLCIVDMDRMLQGRGNDGHWVPDGSHPSDAVLYEYTNVLLNILQQHKDDAAHVARHRDVMRRFDNTMPTSFVSHFNLRDVTSQS